MNYEHSEESHKAQSFIYTIHSEDAVSTNGAVFEFDIGNLNNSHDEYLVEVKDVVLQSTNVDSNNGFLMLIAENLAESGIYSPNKLNSNQAIISTIPVSTGTYMGTNGTFFKTKGLRMTKRIKFIIKKPNFVNAVSGTDINVGGSNTSWFVVLQFTPMMNGLILGGSGSSLTR